MAQAKTFNWYGSEDAVGIPGMKLIRRVMWWTLWSLRVA